LNAIPTPFFTYVYYRGEIMPEYGEERIEKIIALRSLLDAGIIVAPGSEYPIGPYESIIFLLAAVNRENNSSKAWGT